ncbi:MAG: glycoside hydrolase family 2 protein [bacterium]
MALRISSRQVGRLGLCLLALSFACGGDDAQAAKDDLGQHYLSRARSEADSTFLSRQFGSRTQKVLSLNGAWQARSISGESEFVTVQVPGAYSFQGEIEFKRTFELDSTFASQLLSLVALGINNRCKIFLNGEFIISHVVGHTPFSIELPPEKLDFAVPNELRIEVDNTLLPRSSLPLKHHPGISKGYGGIFRDIFLLAIPRVAIKKIRLTPGFSEDFASCQLRSRILFKKSDVAVDEDDELDALTFHVELWQPSEQKLLAASTPESLHLDKRTLSREISLDLTQGELWTPDKPVLYRFKAIISRNREVVDEKSLQIGLNHLTVADRQVVLNGEAVRLLGVDWYEDYAGAGPAAGFLTMEENVRAIKKLGANAVRVVGTPPHPYFLDACDRFGLLVLMELPMSLLPEARLSDPVFEEMVSNYFQEMVEWHAHHASIAAWGLGTDLPLESPPARALTRKLKQFCDEHSTRPLYAAYRFLTPHIPRDIDLVLLNVFGREQPPLSRFDDLDGFDREEDAAMFAFGFPLYLPAGDRTIFGGGGAASQDSSRDAIAAQEVQAYKLNRALLDVSTQEEVAGTFIHTLFDWPESLPNLSFGVPENRNLNRSGIVALDHQQRVAYEIVESFFKENQTRKMSIRLPEAPSPNVYPVAGLGLILVFLFNFNRSRRLRASLRRIFFHPHGFYIELKENRKVSAAHTFLLSLITTASLAVIVSSIAFNFRENSLVNEALNLVVVSDGLKLKLIWLIWHPAISILVLMGGFYLIFGLVAFLLKLAALMLGRSLAVGRFSTLLFWAGASFIWLLPVVPIYYRIISQTQWTTLAFAFLALFFIWFGLRLFRAIKVVLTLSVLKTAILGLVLTAVMVGGVGYYYDNHYALLDYLPLYWRIIAERISFAI